MKHNQAIQQECSGAIEVYNYTPWRRSTYTVAVLLSNGTYCFTKTKNYIYAIHSDTALHCLFIALTLPSPAFSYTCGASLPKIAWETTCPHRKVSLVSVLPNSNTHAKNNSLTLLPKAVAISLYSFCAMVHPL